MIVHAPRASAAPLRLGAAKLLCALGAAAGLSGIGGAQAQPPLKAKAIVNLRVVVPRVVQLLLLSQPPAFEVTATDLERGYVDNAYPMRLAVLSNVREGYTLRFTKHGAFISHAVVSGLQSDLQLGSAMTTVSRSAGHPGLQRDEVTLAVRLHLSEGARPGRYPWPIQVEVLDL